MGHLNSFSASGGGNFNKNFPKIQMPGGLPGEEMLKPGFDWYIIVRILKLNKKRDKSFEFSSILSTVDLSNHLITV